MTTPAAPGAAHPPAALAPIAVLLVDDQLAVRQGLARLIASSALPLRAVASAATGPEALRLAAALRPEVVVLDADLAGEDGLAQGKAAAKTWAGAQRALGHGRYAARLRRGEMHDLARLSEGQATNDQRLGRVGTPPCH